MPTARHAPPQNAIVIHINSNRTIGNKRDTKTDISEECCVEGEVCQQTLRAAGETYMLLQREVHGTLGQPRQTKHNDPR